MLFPSIFFFEACRQTKSHFQNVFCVRTVGFSKMTVHRVCRRCSEMAVLLWQSIISYFYFEYCVFSTWLWYFRGFQIVKMEKSGVCVCVCLLISFTAIRFITVYHWLLEIAFVRQWKLWLLNNLFSPESNLTRKNSYSIIKQFKRRK